MLDGSTAPVVRHSASTLFGGGHLLLTVNATAPPSAGEWREYVELVREIFERRGQRNIYVLVYTLGGSPNEQQQTELIDITPPGSRGRVAVVTPSPSVRHRVTALAQNHAPEYRLYPPGGLRDAISWLGLRADSESAVRAEIQRLLDNVGRSGRGPTTMGADT